MTKKSVLFSDSSLADSLEIVLEPRVMFDGAAVATAEQAADQVNHQADNPDGDNHDAAAQADGDSPVSAQGNGGKVTIDSDGKAQNDSDLFKDVSVATGSYDHLTLDVEASGEGHALVIGGSTVLLKADQSVDLTGDYEGLNVEVKTNGVGKYTVTVYVTGLDVDKVSSLIDSMAYKTADGTKVSAGQTVTVKLSSISDGSEDTALDISTTVTVDSQYNQPPTVDYDKTPELSDQNSAAGDFSAISSDGKVSFVLTSDGKLTAFDTSDGKLSQMGSSIQLDLSADGSSIQDFIVSKDGSKAYVSLYNGRIIEILCADNKVTVSDRVLQITSVDWTGATVNDNAGDLAISDDGKWLFIANGLGEYGGNGRLFTLNLETGLQAWQGDAISADDGYFEYANGYLILTRNGGFPGLDVDVYKVNADGSISQVGQSSHIDIESTGTTKTAISQDGKKIAVYSVSEEYDEDYNSYYVGHVAIFQIGDDGTLSGGTISEISSSVSSLAFSSNGSTLLAVESKEGKGTLISYSIQSDLSVGGDNSIAADLNASADMSIGSNGLLLISGKSSLLFSSSLAGTFGQNIQFGAGITVGDTEFQSANNFNGFQFEAQVSGAEGTFSFSLDGYTQTGDKIFHEGKQVATISAQQGKVTILFDKGCSTEEAKAVVHGISLKATSASGSEVKISVTVSDGNKTQSIDIPVDIKANQAPSAQLSPGADQTVDTAGSQTPVFGEHISISAGESGQLITDLQISVGGLSSVDSSEALIVDGTTISLSQNGSGTTESGISWQYTLKEGKGILVLHKDLGVGLQAAQNLLQGIQYINNAQPDQTDKGLIGEREFSLISITDNGGDAQGGTPTATIENVSAKITLAINTAPIIDSSDTDHSNAVYMPEDVANLVSGQVTSIQSSRDGNYLFVATSSGNFGNGNASFYILAKDAAGKYEVVKTFVPGDQDDPSTPSIEVSGINKITSITQVGNHLYLGAMVDASNASILHFSLGSDNQWSYVGIAAQNNGTDITSLNANVNQMSASADGKYVYAVNGWNPFAASGGATKGAAITVFAVQADGSLQLAQVLSTETGITHPTTISVSESGYVFVSDSNRSIFVFHQGDKGLTLVEKVSADSFAGTELRSDAFKSIYACTVSPDGKTLYVLGNSDYLSSFSIGENGNLTYEKSIVLGDSQFTVSYPSGQMHISADGKSLYISAGMTKNIAAISLDGQGGMNFAGIVEMSARSEIFTVTSNGSLYGGAFSFEGGLRGATQSAVVDTAGNDVAVGSGITITDMEAEAKDDYSGFVITVQRNADTDDTSDTFDFAGSADITIKDGKILYKAMEVGAFTSKDGQASVEITGKIDGKTLNAILAGIVYKVPDGMKDRVDFKITVTDPGHKEATTVVAVIPKDVAIGPSYGEQIYSPGQNIFTDATIHFSEKGEGVISGSSVTITSSDAAADFSLNGDYSLSGTDVKKGDVTIAAWTEDGKGGLQLVFTDQATAADVQGLIRAITYTTGNADPTGNATFSLDFTSADGTSADTCSKAADVLFFTNEIPQWNTDKYADWGITVTPGKAGSVTFPEDLFTDPDAGDKIAKWAVNNLPTGWSFDAQTRVLSWTADGASAGKVTITVTDTHGGDASHEVVIVEAAENTAPEWNSSYNDFFISVNAGETIHAKLPTDLFTDKDGDKLTYSVSGLPSGLSFDAATMSIKGTVAKGGNYVFTIIADDGTATAQHSITIVVDVLTPEANSVFDGLEFQAKPGEKVDFLLPDGLFENADGAQWTIEGLPNGLEFNANSHHITGTMPETPDSDHGFLVNVTVTTSDGQKATTSIYIHPVAEPNSEPKADIGFALSNGAYKDAYEQDLSKLFTDADGDPLHLSIDGLPAGLELKDGKIVGTPNESGAFKVTVYANDGKGGITSWTGMMQIGNADPIWTGNTTTFTQSAGQKFELNLGQYFEDADKDSLTYQVSNLPEGLTYDANTGIISGTVNEATSIVITVTATDTQGGTSAPQHVTLNFTNEAPDFNAPDADHPVKTEAAAGSHYSQNLGQYFVDPEGKTLTFSATGLPDGLTIDASSGVISGDLSKVGSYEITVVAKDPLGASQSYTFTLQVTNDAPVWNDGENVKDLGSFNAGSDWSYNFRDEVTDTEVSMGGTSQKLEFTSSDLPTGFTLDAETGKLSIDKAAVQGGKYSFTISVKDGFGGEAQKIFTLTVANNAPAPVEGSDLAEGSINAGVIKDAFDYDLKGQIADAQGNDFTVTVSGLPEGLSYDDTTGKITGTPTVAVDQAEVTVHVDDGHGGVADYKVNISVRDNTKPTLVPGWSPQNIESQSDGLHLTVDTPVTEVFQDAFTDKEGDPITITVDNLPPGLSWDPSTGTLTGTPTQVGQWVVGISVNDGHGGDPFVGGIVITVDLPPHVLQTQPIVPAPIYDPNVGHELEEELLMPTASASQLPDVSIDLQSSSDTFATSQGLAMAQATIESTEQGSHGLSSAALISAAQVMADQPSSSVSVADQKGLPELMNRHSSMTLQSSMQSSSPDDRFMWESNSVVQDGTPALTGKAPMRNTQHGAIPLPATEVSMNLPKESGKPSLSQLVRDGSTYGSDKDSSSAA